MIHELLRSRGLAALVGFCVLGSAALRAQLYAEDFEDGLISSPFSVEIVPGNTSEIVTPTGFSARAGTKVHRFVWNQANYDGTRPSKSVEGLSGSAKITSEGWYGFSFYMPASFPVPGKTMVLGQIHAWHGSLPNTNITCVVGVETDGRMYLEGAYGIGDGGKTVTVQTTLSPLLAKGSWHDVVLYVKFANNNTGALKAWLDGAPESAPTASYAGINLGNGAWTSPTLMTNGAYIKWGPYCWDSTNYTVSESREIFYDEITYQVGNPTGAFDLVKPTGYGTGYAAPAAGPAVMVETFDTMTTGAPPTGFTILNSGTALTVRDIPSVTDKCMQFYDPNPAGHGEATKTFTAQTSRFTAGFSIRQNGQADGHFVSLRSGTLSAIELYTIGGNLVYRDGSGTDIILQAIPSGVWYDVDVDVNPATFKADVYVGGIRKLTGASFRNATTSIDAIRFGTGDASATWHFYINDITITQAPAAFSENFNVMTTGSSPLRWVRMANTALTVRDVPSVTDKSMQFYDASTTTKGEAYATFVPLSSRLSASWSFKQTGTAEGHRMALMAGTTTTAVEVLTSGGNLVYKNGAGTNVFIQAIPANVWYNVKVIVNPATTQADVYVNDVLKLSNQSLRSAVTSVDRVVFSTSDVSATYHYYVDNVVVTDAGIPPLALLAGNIPRVPIVLKLDDLSTGGGNVPSTWRRVTDFATARQMKVSVGLIAKSLEVGTASYISYIQGLRNAGTADFWFHGYDHIGQEFNGTTYTDQKNRFTTSQSLAMTKLGFQFAGFGAPENAFDNTTVQVMSEDSAMNVWLYGDLARPAGKRVLDRVGAVNIESPTFVPNPEQFVSGYLANYSGRQFFVIQGHPANWTDTRWYEFVRLIDWLKANNFPIKTTTELAATL
ncbi:MAG: heparin lyase I family protein [Rariglobus sp.]